MIEVRQTRLFADWLRTLRDARAVARINVRIARIRTGQLGDTKILGDGVSEARIDYGPGYRLYFARRGAALILLLCGGEKSTQRVDITKAKRLAREE